MASWTSTTNASPPTAAAAGARLARRKLGVSVQIHSVSFCFDIYSASVLGNLFIRFFHAVLLSVWLTFAALRIFSLAASHPQEATVLSLTSFASATFRGSPPGNPSSSFVPSPAAVVPSITSRSASSSPCDTRCGVRRYARDFADSFLSPISFSASVQTPAYPNTTRASNDSSVRPPRRATAPDRFCAFPPVAHSPSQATPGIIQHALASPAAHDTGPHGIKVNVIHQAPVVLGQFPLHHHGLVTVPEHPSPCPVPHVEASPRVLTNRSRSPSSRTISQRPWHGPGNTEHRMPKCQFPLNEV